MLNTLDSTVEDKTFYCGETKLKPEGNDVVLANGELIANQDETCDFNGPALPSLVHFNAEGISSEKVSSFETRMEGDQNSQEGMYNLQRATVIVKETEEIVSSDCNDIFKKHSDDENSEYGNENAQIDVEADDAVNTDASRAVLKEVANSTTDTESAAIFSSLTPADNSDRNVVLETIGNDALICGSDIQHEEPLQDGEPCGHSFDPTEVLNVEIALQDPSKNTQAGEPCKKVQGEAVERTHNRAPSNSGCIFADEDDTIDSNIHWVDEDDERIDLDYSPPHSPHGSEHSLFPAPQMNYNSIYSQDTVSLSEISLSEPEHDLPATDKEIHDIHNAESLAMLSLDSSELTDIEDNRCYSPAVNLDRDGAVELTDASFLHHRYIGGSSRGSIKTSTCSSPSIFEIDSPVPMSPHSMAEKVSERLRLLADSWADVPVPSSGSVQSIAVTDTLVWCVDNHEHVFVTQSSSADVHWKKIDGKLRHIAANQSGTIVWGINRKKFALYRANMKNSNPHGKSRLCCICCGIIFKS